ncbi:MAG TPA: SDR family NAD(P)-dependent oxidoreductase [Croceibacterium sp.]
MTQRKFAVITGASSGIGLELAKLAAADGFDLLLAADRSFDEAMAALSGFAVEVGSIQADLATDEGVACLLGLVGERPVDVLVANAGHGLGHAFLEQDPKDWRHVIDSNVTGTLLLLQPIVRRMAARGEGRVLLTGSIAGHIAGSFQAVYNGTKAFVDSFSDALGNELKDSGVTVTCLKPGATDTEFFARADMLDTKVGQAKKDDPAAVARTGWEAMLSGERSVVHGLLNKLQVAGAKIAGGGVAAGMHRKQAEPGSAEDKSREEQAQ